MINNEYTHKHFSLALFQGEDHASIPLLLRHLAETLDSNLPDINVLDITFENGIDANGDPIPSFTVYYLDNKV